MKLILTRHGETIENMAGIIQGHSHGTLSSKGIEQAQKVALRLKNEKIDAIYSSDLGRAANTAKEITKYYPSVQIKIVKELRERDLGEFQGKTFQEIGWKNVESQYDITYLQPKRGENLMQLHQRAKQFLDTLIHKHKRDTVLIVGHNGINKAIISVIMNKGSDEVPKIEKLKSTGITIFEIDENKNYKIQVFNCVKHLA